MERYNYREAITADVLEYIRENIELEEWRGKRDELEDELEAIDDEEE